MALIRYGVMTLAIALVGLTLFESVAGVTKIDAPAGWSFSTSEPQLAVGGVGIAVVAYKYADEPYDFIENSRIIQVEGSTTTTTDFDGKVFWIEYPPHGGNLLALWVESGSRYVSLVDGAGTVLWTREDKRAFEFSVDGSRLLAWVPSLDRRLSEARNYEVFDLSGNSVVKVDAGNFTNAALLLDAERILFGFGHTLEKINIGSSPPGVDWTVHLNELDASIVAIRPFGPDYVEIKHGRNVTTSVYKISDGSVHVRFDPETLAVGDPERSEEDYAKFSLAPGSVAGMLILSKSDEVVSVEISTGSTTPIKPLTIPPGHVLVDGVRGGQVFMVSASRWLIFPS